MFAIIVFIISIGSLAGIIFMIIRKLPVLRTLPVEQDIGPDFLGLLKQKIKENDFVRNFSWEKFLEKVLLRTERQSNSWLKQLKERTAAQKAILSDDYWKELKKSTRFAEYIPIEEQPEIEKAKEVKIKVKTRKPGMRRRKKVS